MGRGYNKNCVLSTALDVPKRIIAVLYVSIMGLTRCYKTTVFFTFIIGLTDRKFKRKVRRAEIVAERAENLVCGSASVRVVIE